MDDDPNILIGLKWRADCVSAVQDLPTEEHKKNKKGQRDSQIQRNFENALFKISRYIEY